MRRNIQRAVVLSLSLAIGASGQNAPAGSETQGAISGKVVTVGSRRPLRGVMVSLVTQSGTNREWRLSETVLTSDAGAFLFDKLPPGSYGFRCFKTGYGNAINVLQEVLLRSGEHVDDVELELPPPGVITGTVLYPGGNGMPEAQVIAERAVTVFGPAQLEEAGRAVADEQGRYRIWGLTAGRYWVRAKERYQGSSPTFAPTYYPNGTDWATAAQVRLDWDAEADGIDIQLPPAARTLVRGVLRDGTTGAAVPNQGIKFISDDGRFKREEQGINSAKDGTFHIEGLPPGSYTLAASQPDPRLYAYTKVQLVPNQVNEVELLLLPGTEVSGRARAARFDDGIASGPVKASWSSISLRGEHHWNGNDTVTTLGSDGNFMLKNVAPGTYRVQTNCAIENGYAASLSVAGIPLPSLDLTIGAGAALKDLEVGCGFELGELRGAIKPSIDAAPFPRVPYVRVWHVPVGDSAVNEIGCSFTRSARFTGLWLYPGRYTLYAVSNWLPLDWEDPEIRRVLAPYGKTVDIRPGEPVEVELVFVPSSFRLP